MPSEMQQKPLEENYKEALKQYLNVFSPLKEKTWKAIEPCFSLAQLKKGEYYIHEGQTAQNFAFLRQGVVRAFYRNQQGTEYNKRFFIRPSIIGSYASLITGEPSLFTQQALTDCSLLEANYHAFTEFFDTHPDLERVARKFAERYFVENERKEIEIVLLTADQRYQYFQENYPGLEQQIPQYQIASFLGITPTQLSRIRKNKRQ